MGPRLEEDDDANGRGKRKGGCQGGEERWRVQAARPLKGRCGWQLLTLATMGFHQRLLMKADCQGIVREPRGREESRGWRGERTRESEKREGREREKRIEERLR